MNFKQWLEVDAHKYDQLFKYKTDNAQKKSKDLFSHFFPPNKLRLAIKPKNIDQSAFVHSKIDPDLVSAEDRNVIYLLKKYGYEVTDYQGGYVRRGKGIERIGKVFERLLKTTADEKAKQDISSAMTRFINSSARKFTDANNLWIIISRNPHDIAQMSFTRDWKSCMDIDGGQYCRAPFNLIKSGGLVAYLVNASDNRIKTLLNEPNTYIDSKEAIARVSIKPSVNKEGKVMASLEHRVYPYNVKGFWESVYDWLEEKQVGEGRFDVKGGYSDTFDKTHTFAPRDHRGLWEYLTSKMENRSKSALYHILNSREDFPPVILEKVKEILVNKVKLEYKGNPTSDTDTFKMLVYFIKKYNDMFSDDEIESLPYEIKRKLGKISENDLYIRDVMIGNKALKSYDVDKLKQIFDDIFHNKYKLHDNHTLHFISDWLSHSISSRDEDFLNQSKNLSYKILQAVSKLIDEKLDWHVVTTISNIYGRIIRISPTVENIKLIQVGLEKLSKNHTMNTFWKVKDAILDRIGIEGKSNQILADIIEKFFPSSKYWS